MLFSILFIQIQAFDDFLIAFLHKEKVFFTNKKVKFVLCIS